MSYLFFFMLLFLGNCTQKEPQEKANIPIIPQKHIKAKAMDTLKPLFKTIPLEGIKTHVSDWKESLEAGKPLKIVCYGNSITHGYKTGSFGKVAHPYPESLQEKWRIKYPKASLTIKNEGHSGWRADQALQMVGKLVLPEKPDWVILELGINDAYSSFSPVIYINYMKQLVQIFRQNNIKVLLMTATPIATKYHEKVLAYHAPLRALAESEGCAFFDLATYIADRAMHEKLTAKQLLPDDIHFADAQYVWIAEGLTTFLGF